MRLSIQAWPAGCRAGRSAGPAEVPGNRGQRHELPRRSGGHLRLSPVIAAAAKALSSLSVVGNASRLRRWRSAALPSAALPATGETPTGETPGERPFRPAAMERDVRQQVAGGSPRRERAA